MSPKLAGDLGVAGGPGMAVKCSTVLADSQLMRVRLWGLAVLVAGLALVSDSARAAPLSSPARYRASLNAICRANTVKLGALEAELARANKAGDRVAYAVALGEYFGLGLREDATIETTPVPAPLRATMAAATNLLKRVDARVRAVLAALAARNAQAMEAEARQVAALGGPINRALDTAGLRDCGSNQH
jgi:hypothetical protein